MEYNNEFDANRLNFVIVGIMDDYNNLVAQELSTYSRKLDKEGGLFYCDFTELFNRVCEFPIPYMIREFGFDFYYKKESQHLVGIRDYENVVIAASSSGSLREENIELLKKYCYVITVYASDVMQQNSIANNNKIVNRQDLLVNYPKYKDFIHNKLIGLSDFSIDCTKILPKTVARRIMKMLMDKLDEIYMEETND